MKPDGAEGVGVIVGKHALAVKGGGHREAEQLGEPPQWFGRPRAGRSVPRQDDGSPTRVEHRGRPLESARVRAHRAGDELRSRGVRSSGYEGILNVLRYAEIHGTRALGLGQLERLADHLGD
jgi:hypothetical protein